MLIIIIIIMIIKCSQSSGTYKYDQKLNKFKTGTYSVKCAVLLNKQDHDDKRKKDVNTYKPVGSNPHKWLQEKGYWFYN